MLSVVIPSYNEEGNISLAAGAIADVLQGGKIEYELVFVDDGSKDGTWKEILGLNRADKRINGIRLSRNFGKEGAILAGLESCRGDAAVVMDCDLQHPPETILEMYALWQNGAKVVEGRKSSRGKENAVYGCFSRLFYRLIESAAKINLRDSSDFKLIDRRVIDTILALPERITFFRALSGWVGFESAAVYYDVRERQIGRRKFTAGMLIGYAIRSITSFTGIPLYISSIAGLLVIICSLVLMVLLLCRVDLGSFNAAVVVLMLLGGVILECMGILCYYVSRIYEETKHRPRYIVADSTHDNDVKPSQT